MQMTWTSPEVSGGPFTKAAVVAIDDRPDVRPPIEEAGVKVGTTAGVLSLADAKTDKAEAAERLDALTGGSGFSFGDPAADRGGVRFAEVATRSESDAQAIQQRIPSGFSVYDFFTNISNLSERLTVEQFRAEYGGVSSARYRDQVREIETRLSQCAALSVL